MNGQNQEPPELKELDIKAELKRAQVSLHNARIQVQIQEAVVKKFQELAR